MELSGFCIENFLIFSYISANGNPPNILYISGKVNPKKLLIFQEMELCDYKTNKFCIFPEMGPCTFQPKLEK